MKMMKGFILLLLTVLLASTLLVEARRRQNRRNEVAKPKDNFDPYEVLGIDDEGERLCYNIAYINIG
jgi:preprotein translocase subunit Sec63